MDARALALALDEAARALSSVTCELTAAGFGLGQAVGRTVWHGRAADAACDVLAADVVALGECALAADRAARSTALAAIEAWEIAAVVQRLP